MESKKEKQKEGDKKESSEEEKSLEGKIIEIKRDVIEDKKTSTKDIIPEFTESRTRNFLNFLNRNSSVTLDRKNPFEEIPKSLELNLESSSQKKPQTQNQNIENENPLEYLPKNSEDKKQQGFYQALDDGSRKNFSQNNSNFREVRSENTSQQKSNYEVYIKPQEQGKKEKDKFQFKESKMEYYSHK